MIKLADILKESFYKKENCHSWQTPVGNFYRIRDTHDMDARMKIVPIGTRDAMMEAWKKGYNRIIYMGDTLYAHNEVRPPSEIQLHHLIQLAKENGFNKVVYDAGTNEHILWSVHDVLQ